MPNTQDINLGGEVGCMLTKGPWMQGAQWMECQSFLNQLAFSKIMKKYDKVKVAKLLDMVEAAFVMHFCNGNRHQEMNTLRPKAERYRHKVCVVALNTNTLDIQGPILTSLSAYFKIMWLHFDTTSEHLCSLLELLSRTSFGQFLLLSDNDVIAFTTERMCLLAIFLVNLCGPELGAGLGA
ncbi:hypothetical protein Tco_0550217 [Tanacetum coccineum]